MKDTVTVEEENIRSFEEDKEDKEESKPFNGFEGDRLLQTLVWEHSNRSIGEIIGLYDKIIEIRESSH